MISISRQEIRSALEQYIVSLSIMPEGKHQLDEMAVPSYLHGNPLVRWIIRERLWALHHILCKEGKKRGKGGCLLDFGCGIGLLGVMQSAYVEKTVAVDLVIEPAKLIKEHYRVENMMPIAAVDFHWSDWQNAFDHVVAADVLEHVDNLDSFLDNIASVLRPEGRFFLSGPTESWFYGLCRKIAGFTGEYHHRNIYDIEKQLSDKGWHRTEVKAIPWFLPFKMFRVSVWKRKLP